MTNVIKFQSPFERMKSYNTCPDISLRKAIILQAIIDASNTSDISELKKIEVEAKHWLFCTNNTFEDTCIEADMKPSLVRKIAKKIIRLHRNAKLTLQKRSVRQKHLTQYSTSTKRVRFNSR